MRQAVLQIPVETIDRLVRSKSTIDLISDVPPDAELKGYHFSFITLCMELVYEHPSFDDVPEGRVRPYLLFAQLIEH
jgi:hypothetical protein